MLEINKNRTLLHKKGAALGEENHAGSKSNNKDRRSNSSPNTLVVENQQDPNLTSIVQSSDANTNHRDLHSANLIRGIRGSDEASNSNNASSTMHELHSKIKILA